MSITLEEVERVHEAMSLDPVALRAEIEERDRIIEIDRTAERETAVEQYETLRSDVAELDRQTAQARVEFATASVQDMQGLSRDVGAYARFQGRAAEANAKRLQLHALLAKALSLGAENLSPLPTPGEGDRLGEA